MNNTNNYKITELARAFICKSRPCLNIFTMVYIIYLHRF